MVGRLIASVFFALSVSSISSCLQGDIALPSIFSDHAVLQRSGSVPIWGRAKPGERITVEIGLAGATASADKNGEWRALLDLSNIKEGPWNLRVKGNNVLIISDVMVGEVWLCSGQSNMAWPVRGAQGSDKELANSENKQLRQFLVAPSVSTAPESDCEGRWTVAGPGMTGAFSAVGYFFGKTLQERLHLPIGLINATVGGSNIERWISVQGFENDPNLKRSTERYLTSCKTFEDQFSKFLRAEKEFEDKYSREDYPTPNILEFAGNGTATEEWTRIQLPGHFRDFGLPDAGIIWLRRNVVIPHDLVGEGLILQLGRIQGFETVFWNGRQIAETTPKQPGASDPRGAWIPGELITGQPAVLAIRVYCPGGDAGMAGEGRFRLASPREYIARGPEGNIDETRPIQVASVELSGPWLGRAERAFNNLDQVAKTAYVWPPSLPVIGSKPKSLVRFFGGSDRIPSGLFNGMIAPIIPYGLRGVIWYQGEDNTSTAWQYRKTFEILINDWREHWGCQTFPFYFCQLPNYSIRTESPGQSTWAELREAQAKALSLERTGMAVLIDIGEEGDIHPRDKKDVGERLALIARHDVYGEKVAYSGPIYQAMTVTRNCIVVDFQHTEGGLVAKDLPPVYRLKAATPDVAVLNRHAPGGELEGFAICGQDRKWKWASANIQNDRVVVWSPEVVHPIAVRYAWADNPICNLYNKSGLPAAPFRTDNFRLTTQDNRY
jgi:sialate O-acetylesterase